MKSLLFLMLSLLMVCTGEQKRTARQLAFASPTAETPKKVKNTSTSPAAKELATCYGNSPCKACSSCRYCKHCNGGGSCGVCKPAGKTPASEKRPIVQSSSQPASASSQCTGTTQKGLRCKRMVKGGGRCWQH